MGGIVEKLERTINNAAAAHARADKSLAVMKLISAEIGTEKRGVGCTDRHQRQKRQKWMKTGGFSDLLAGDIPRVLLGQKKITAVKPFSGTGDLQEPGVSVDEKSPLNAQVKKVFSSLATDLSEHSRLAAEQLAEHVVNKGVQRKMSLTSPGMGLESVLVKAEDIVEDDGN